MNIPREKHLFEVEQNGHCEMQSQGFSIFHTLQFSEGDGGISLLAPSILYFCNSPEVLSKLKGVCDEEHNSKPMLGVNVNECSSFWLC